MASPLTPLRTRLSEFDSLRRELVEEYFTFLRFPSVSSEAAHRKDVRACAEWVVKFLSDSGFDVELWEGSGEGHEHPTIFASWMKAGPDRPTVLIYNHYDVQPVDPLELWTSPPFEPRLEGEEVFARGAEDNKGQCFYVMAAVRHLLRTTGTLPVNLKLCIEGEEETGSTVLSRLLADKRKELAADYLYVVDVGLHEPTAPAVTLGVRGIQTMTIELRGSRGDLHSGMVGGIVYNPNRALAELLASLYHPDGRVAVEGFYDDVAPISEEERRQLDFSFDTDQFRAMFGAEPNGGENAFAPIERVWIRPTLEINGMNGGYSGDGFKTVIPAVASAKLSCRLVPDQDPARMGALVEKHLRDRVPLGMELQVHIHGAGTAARTPIDAHAVQVAAAALTELFEKPCHFILSGGSIPIAAGLAESSGAELVLIGFGLPDDNIHAPNEHFGVDRVRKGFATMINILERIGAPA